MAETVQQESPPSWSLWTSSSYAVVMVLIGLPLWWNTTTVHRAPLPYYEMLTLQDQLKINFTHDQPEFNNMELELPLSAGYDILITLLIPEPEIFDATWNIREGIQEFIEPMLQKLDGFGEFSIRSQILYYVKLNVRPQLNKKTKIYEVTHDQLPLVINTVESKLTSFVSQNPVLNFLVYVSPCSTNPMQILDADGSYIDSNGFFVPQWGGIQIYNGLCSSQENMTEPNEVFMPSIMNVIIPHFRALLGITPTNDKVPQTKSLQDAEIEKLLKKRLERLLFTSANTLKSLGNLLDQITNIVVRDEVGEEVERSVNSLKLSYAEAQAGNLRAALQHAIISYKSSEVAFHHPSNLAQLYFPDDQKYAIYIPLFLPVGIPVLLSLRSIMQAFKVWYQKRK